MSMTSAERRQRIDQYERGPLRIHDALNLVPDEAVKWRPAPGKWTVHEVIIHCADSETNSHMRIRYLLGEDDALIVGYDQDRWANVLGYHDLPLEPALATVRAVRANTLPLLRRLTEQQWNRTGRHTEFGAIAGAAVVLVLAAIAAGYGPAWRASRIDPWNALRHE